MKKHNVVPFGEILLRLSPMNHLRFDLTAGFEGIFSEAEFNVAVSLSNFGINTKVIMAIPDKDIANCTLDIIKKDAGYQYII